MSIAIFKYLPCESCPKHPCYDTPPVTLHDQADKCMICGRESK